MEQPPLCCLRLLYVPFTALQPPFSSLVVDSLHPSKFRVANSFSTLRTAIAAIMTTFVKAGNVLNLVKY